MDEQTLACDLGHTAGAQLGISSFFGFDGAYAEITAAPIRTDAKSGAR
jgi:hypothetical protein